jgi:hypothetical protein
VPAELANLPPLSEVGGAEMMRGAARLAALALPLALNGCTTPHADVMRGTASGVQVNYVGDIAVTVPLAQQYCARFERVPVLHETKEDNAYYFCVPPSEAPR